MCKATTTVWKTFPAMTTTGKRTQPTPRKVRLSSPTQPPTCFESSSMLAQTIVVAVTLAVIAHAFDAAPSTGFWVHVPCNIPGAQALSDNATPRRTPSSLSSPVTDFAEFFQPRHQQGRALERIGWPNIIELMPTGSDEAPGSPSALKSDATSPTGKSRDDGNGNGKTRSYENRKPLRQQLFTSPLISVLYERILPPLWEAGLRIGGPDAEYDAATSHLTGDGTGILLDLSCGTGFVARRFAKAGRYQHVFALDYSLQMLGECKATIQRDVAETSQRSSIGSNTDGAYWNDLSLIRGDACKLPFRDATLDAVHWGAAMHCVPDAEMAMCEIYRVLKPGGKLYATTFLRPFPDVVFRFFELHEIEQLARDAGFGERSGRNNAGEALSVSRVGVYGVLKAKKGME